MKNNIIKEKTYQFSLDIIQLFITIRDQKEFVLSKQLLRSAKSIGANIEEALAGQSRKDFTLTLHKALGQKRYARSISGPQRVFRSFSRLHRMFNTPSPLKTPESPLPP